MSRTVSTPELLDLIHQTDETGEKKPFSLRWVTLDATRKEKPSKHMHTARAVTITTVSKVGLSFPSFAFIHSKMT
jgi:hypothetical protein